MVRDLVRASDRTAVERLRRYRRPSRPVRRMAPRSSSLVSKYTEESAALSEGLATGSCLRGPFGRPRAPEVGELSASLFPLLPAAHNVDEKDDDAESRQPTEDDKQVGFHQTSSAKCSATDRMNVQRAIPRISRAIEKLAARNCPNTSAPSARFAVSGSLSASSSRCVVSIVASSLPPSHGPTNARPQRDRRTIPLGHQHSAADARDTSLHPTIHAAQREPLQLWPNPRRARRSHASRGLFPASTLYATPTGVAPISRRRAAAPTAARRPVASGVRAVRCREKLRRCGRLRQCRGA